MKSQQTCVGARAASRRFIGNSEGVAAIEAAIILPVFLTFGFFVMEFGRLFYSKLEFEYAMSAAARYGMVAKTASQSQIEQKLREQLILLNPANLTTSSFNQVTNANNTKTTTLVMTYRVEFMIPLTSTQSVTLTKTTTFLRGT